MPDNELLKKIPFPLDYTLKDVAKIKPNGIKVFSTFACGGGSSIGYKLAGSDVVGFCEINPKIADIYQSNLKPKESFVESITDFNKRKVFPEVLSNIDILDGSPPCTPFSGLKKNDVKNKEKGNRKVFPEGKVLQVLDTLPFHFIHTIGILNPEVAIMENVTGILREKKMIAEIKELARFYGRYLKIIKVNLKYMGVPHSRTRVFFIFTRKNKLINIQSVNSEIKIREFFDLKTDIGKDITGIKTPNRWKMCLVGNSFSYFLGQRSGSTSFSTIKISSDKVLPCVTVKNDYFHWEHPNRFSKEFYRKACTFPKDYDFKGKDYFILGMSVPPFGMYNLSKQIIEQYF